MFIHASFLLYLQYMKTTLKKLRNSLIPLYGKGETEAIIRIIFHHLKNWNLTDILIHKEDELSPFIIEQIDEILERLLKFEPIQYITGEARFHGMELKIKPGVLIPRPETEELVDIIIDRNKERDDLRILDVCTGSGCIALALARNLPFSKVTAIDISPLAIEIARENSDLLKTKVKIVENDIFEWNPHEKYDIIVSNPPYVLDKEALHMEKNVLNYEPHEALFVIDDNPLVFYERISDLSLECLAENGELYFEINPLFADSLKKMLEKKGFSEVSIIRDSYGKERFISSVLQA